MHELTRARIEAATPSPPPAVPGIEGLRFPDEARLRAEMLVFLHGYPAGHGVWLFAHGVLMASPGLASPDIVAAARVRGHVRASSLYDVTDRGTAAAPGLTFGLEPGPEGVVSGCAGLLLHLPGPDPRGALWPAWRREMGPGFQEPSWVDTVMLPSEAPVRAMAFLPKPGHPLHAGRLPVATVAERVARARGPGGTAADALLDVIAALRERQLRDPGLEMLAGEVARRLAGRDAGIRPDGRPEREAVSRPTVRVGPTT